MVTDQQLVWAYAATGERVDRVAAFHHIRECFVRQFPRELTLEEQDFAIWRLFELQKAGKLPRPRKDGV